jgi:hypothetical protein
MASEPKKGGIAPGLYILDVKEAVLHLASGKLAGTCKVCGREFRIPSDIAKWRSFYIEMQAHPLEHDQSEALKRRVERLLAALDDGSLIREAQNDLLRTITPDLEKLAESGVLKKVRHD